MLHAAVPWLWQYGRAAGAASFSGHSAFDAIGRPIGIRSRPELSHDCSKWGCAVQVRHRLFEATFKSWETLCEEAAAFATTVGRDRLINISVSQADTGGKGVIFVWFWE